MGQDQTALVTWRDGRLPVSTRFDDPYFSLENGLAETRHVFLDGNDLPARLRPGFHVAELGFGTGLNMLALLALWRASGLAGTMRFTSFEAFPMSAPDVATALTAFPDLAPVAPPFLEAWARGRRAFEIDSLQVDIVVGDVRDTLPRWPGSADAWFLDGFSPAKNPEMWGPDLMEEVARHTAPGGTCATYTAAGFVRRGLEQAGFSVDRRPGFGRKRHMTRGWMRSAG